MQFSAEVLAPLATRWGFAKQLAAPIPAPTLPSGWLSDLRVEENLTEVVVLLERCLQYDQLSCDYVSRAQESHWLLSTMGANIASLKNQISSLDARQTAIPAETKELALVESFRKAAHSGRAAMVGLMQDQRHNIAQGLTTPRTAQEDWRIARATDELNAAVNSGKADEHASKVQSSALASSLTAVSGELSSLRTQLEVQERVFSERTETAVAPHGELNFLKRALMYQKLRSRDLAEASARVDAACRGLASVFGWKTAAPKMDEVGDAIYWAREVLYDILRLREIERTTTTQLEVRKRSKPTIDAGGQESFKFEIKEEDILGAGNVSLVRLLDVRVFLSTRAGAVGEHHVVVSAPTRASRVYAMPGGCVGFPPLSAASMISVQPACEQRFSSVSRIDERRPTGQVLSNFQNASPIGSWEIRASGLAKEEILLELDVSYIPL